MEMSHFHSHLNCQIPPGSPVELVLPRPLCCKLSCFCCHGYSLLLLSYLTYSGSVIRTLPAALVDNIYRIFMISFLTVLPQSLHANLSLTLSTLSVFDLVIQTLRGCPAIETLQSSFAPPIHYLSRKSP